MATFAKKFLGLFRTLLHLKAVQIRFKLINKETECIEIKKKKPRMVTKSYLQHKLLAKTYKHTIMIR